MYHKPENALKRADELIAVGQPAAAFNLLQDIIFSRRHRSAPLAILEPIMLKFVSLGVNLQKGKVIREGLHTYRNIMLNISVNTIETVIKNLIRDAAAKVKEAQNIVDAINLDTVEDLEALETPESLMLSTVSAEYKDRKDKEVVTPWVKFLWETYRIALDALRNNTKLEVLYQQIGVEAFGFCLKYGRKTEFKRLSELLRQHLANASKHSNQTFGINLNDLETLQRYLDMRFVQLNAATQLELWQEAFRTTEDIQSLLSASNRPSKAFMVASYYENLARTFMVGENYLFHAAAWNKYYETVQKNKNLTHEELEKIASLVLISALAVPLGIEKSQSDNPFLYQVDKGRDKRFISLLRAEKLPTREQLVREALDSNVFSKVYPELKNLVKILEVDFHPLLICQKIAPILEFLSSKVELEKYVKPLHNVVLTRLLNQLAQVYSSVSLDFVVKLASFPKPYDYDSFRIQKFILRGCQKREFHIRIDHFKKSLTFCDDFAQMENRNSKKSSLNDIVSYMKSLAETLSRSANKAEKCKQGESREIDLMKEQAAVAKRLLLIEKKKQLQETEAQLKEREEQLIRTLKLQKDLEAEKIRLEEETKRRENERLIQQRKEIQKAEALKLAEKLAQELMDKNIKVNKEELENLDTDKLKAMQVQQLEKERKDLQLKSKMLIKRYDHIERAYRKTEIDRLLKEYENQQKHDKENFELKCKADLENSKLQYEKDMEIKSRLKIMHADYLSYKSGIMNKREEAFKIKKAEMDKKLEDAKKKRIDEYKFLRLEQEKKEKEEATKNAEIERKRKEEEENRLALIAQQAEENRAKQEEEEKKKNAWRPTGRFNASISSLPKTEETNGKYNPPAPAKFMPRKEAVSSTPFSASEAKARGKYAPPREVVASSPYSSITKPKDTPSEEIKPSTKWVPPHLRKK